MKCINSYTVILSYETFAKAHTNICSNDGAVLIQLSSIIKEKEVTPSSIKKTAPNWSKSKHNAGRAIARYSQLWLFTLYDVEPPKKLIQLAKSRSYNQLLCRKMIEAFRGREKNKFWYKVFCQKKITTWSHKYDACFLRKWCVRIVCTLNNLGSIKLSSSSVPMTRSLAIKLAFYCCNLIIIMRAFHFSSAPDNRRIFAVKCSVV